MASGKGKLSPCDKLLQAVASNPAETRLAQQVCDDLKWALSELHYVYNDMDVEISSFDEVDPETNVSNRDTMYKLVKTYHVE